MLYWLMLQTVFLSIIICLFIVITTLVCRSCTLIIYCSLLFLLISPIGKWILKLLQKKPYFRIAKLAEGISNPHEITLIRLNIQDTTLYIRVYFSTSQMDSNCCVAHWTLSHMLCAFNLETQPLTVEETQVFGLMID